MNQLDARNFSLLRRVFLPLLLAIFLFCILLGYHHIVASRTTGQIYATLSRAVMKQVDVMNTTIDGQYITLEAVSSALGSSTTITDDMSEIMSILVDVESSTHFYTMGVVLPGGNAYDVTQGKISLKNQPFFQQAMQGERCMLLTGSGDGVFVQAVPIRQGRNIVGVLYGMSKLFDFSILLETDVFDGQSFSILCNSAGTIATGHRIPKGFGDTVPFFTPGPPGKHPPLPFAPEKSEVHFLLTEDSRYYAGYHVLSDSDWYVVTLVPDEVLQAQVFSSLRGTYFMLLLMASCLSLLFIFNLISERKLSRLTGERQAQELARVRKQAEMDALTGLFNRQTAEERISDFLDSAEGHAGQHALLVLDLDNFKAVNDTFGHQTGDEVLRIFAGLLRAGVRSTDIVGRLGGDEFIALLRDTQLIPNLRERVSQLTESLDYLHSSGSSSVNITGSIGVSVCDYGGLKTYQTLFDEADRALYLAKSNGKRAFCFFSPELMESRAFGQGSASIQLQAVMENIDGGILLMEMGAEIRTLYLSPSFFKMLHHREDGAQNAALLRAEDEAAVEGPLRLAATSGTPVEIVFRSEWTGGKRYWFQLRAVRIPYEASASPVLIAIMTDVSVMKNSELEILARQKQLESVLKVSGATGMEIDIELHSLRVDLRATDKYCLSVQTENVPDSLLDAKVIHPDSAEDFRAFFRQIDSGEPEGTIVVSLLGRNQRYEHVRLSYMTLFDDSGTPLKAVGVVEGMELLSDAVLRFEQEDQIFRHHGGNLHTVVRINVTRNQAELIQYNYAKTASPKTTWDALLLRLLDFLPHAVRGEVETGFSLSALLLAHQNHRQSITLERQDSIGRWLAGTALLVPDASSGDLYAFLYIRDVDLRKRLETGLSPELYTEPIDGLYQRKHLTALAGIALTRATALCAVYLVDIRDFLPLSQQLGERTMSRILSSIAHKLDLLLDTTHFSCYWGDGRFVIFSMNCPSSDAALEQVQELYHLLRDPMLLLYHSEADIQYNIGVTVEPAAGTTFYRLLAEAQIALRSDGDSPLFQKP
ncbi:MAG: diguanylate cyclase [Oscillospiraceae bacterium]